MANIPRDTRLDNSLALLKEGNTFITSRCERYASDIFQTRLMLKDTLCLRGEAAARLFYDEARFTREGAAPGFIVSTLFGQGGVQGLDGEMHRVRKRLFMELVSGDAQIAELTRLAAEEWQRAIGAWQARGRVVLFHEIREIHTRAICRWAGVPLKDQDVTQRCQDLVAMVEGAGDPIGKRHWLARRARTRAEAWIADLVEQVRANTFAADEESALFRLSWHRDADGQLLTPKVAAVEMLSILRTTMAVGRFVMLAALALHEHPAWRTTLRDDDAWLEPFTQEVRRYYGFFPFLAARVREEFDWNGYHFPKGMRVMLDLYGTNRDPRSWREPDTFRPERFEREAINEYNLIPQGGGDHYVNHRCPGEWFTIALIKEGLRQLTRNMEYRVPEQNLHIDWSQIPIVPASHFVIDEVKVVAGH